MHQHVLASRQCANIFIAGHCSEAFGGHLAFVAPELDGGALEVTSYYIGLARTFVSMPVGDAALPTAMADLMAANIDHVIPCMLRLQYYLRMRLIASVDTSGTYIMLLGVSWFFIVYRRTAEQLRHISQQLMSVLDVVVRSVVPPIDAAPLFWVIGAEGSHLQCSARPRPLLFSTTLRLKMFDIRKA